MFVQTFELKEESKNQVYYAVLIHSHDQKKKIRKKVRSGMPKQNNAACLN